jgi:hypothetical protein
MMQLHPDFNDLLAEFVHGKVRFVVLGGYAVGHHGKPRATKDLDLLISREDGNLERAALAISKFGALRSVVENVRTLKLNEIAFLGISPVGARRYHVSRRRNRYGACSFARSDRDGVGAGRAYDLSRGPSCKQARSRKTARLGRRSTSRKNGSTSLTCLERRRRMFDA